MTGYFKNAFYSRDIKFKNNFKLDYNNEFNITMNIDGVEFGSDWLDCFYLNCNIDSSEKLKNFDLINEYEIYTNVQNMLLQNYELTINIPIMLGNFYSNDIEGIFSITHMDNNGSNNILSFSLTIDKQQYFAKVITGLYEDSIRDIFIQIKDKYYLKCCIGCQYSDYSPYGSGCFGTMLCFYKVSEQYMKVYSKDEFFSVHDYGVICQETFICPNFKPRQTNCGYWGGL